MVSSTTIPSFCPHQSAVFHAELSAAYDETLTSALGRGCWLKEAVKRLLVTAWAAPRRGAQPSQFLRPLTVAGRIVYIPQQTLALEC